MTCGDGDNEAFIPREVVERLFQQLDEVGQERLHEIERAIVTHLRERPVTKWCRVHAQMLDEMVKKAAGVGNIGWRWKSYVRD